MQRPFTPCKDEGLGKVLGPNVVSYRKDEIAVRANAECASMGDVPGMLPFVAPPSTAQEYQNYLNQPHLWGTRRVGPDLSREGGKRTNDWHIAHFINPKDVVPWSVMPAYAYFFDERGTPTKDGFALITYLQWLGSTVVLPEEGGVTL